MDVSLVSLNRTAWEHILNHIEGATVFIDAKASECLHWSNGTTELSCRGAKSIREFSAYKYFQDGHAEDSERAIFISPEYLSTKQVDLCDILSQSSFHTTTLVVGPMQDSAVLSRLKKDIIQWMSMSTGSTEGLSADILSFPFFMAPLTDTVFMLPPFRDLFPPLDFNKPGISLGSKPSASPMHRRHQTAAGHLAVSIDSLLGQLHVQDVVFSIGQLSGAVAAALEALPSTHVRRKAAKQNMSVVIVDRTLDLCSPASVDSSSFLDKILTALPHLPAHSIDVAINMSPLTQVTVDSAHDEAVFPGCLAHQQESVCLNIMEWLLHKKDRDILLNLHQILNSKLANNVKLVTRVKPETLEKDVRQYRGKYEKIQPNKGLLEMALGVVQTLTGEHAEELELILSVEKVLRQNLTTAADSNELSGLLPQVTKLVVERHIRGLTVDAILTLLVLLYSLIGSDLTFPLRDEVQLQKAISTALFEDQEYPGVVHATLMPLESSKEQVDAVAMQVFASLKAVSLARRDLTHYKSLLDKQGKSMPSEYTPLLQRLMRDILDSSRTPIQDLVCQSGGLRDLFKSGFSLLLNKSQAMAAQHPADQPHLLLLVLGGLTGKEVQLAQQAWWSSSHGMSGGTFLIGSTRLLSPRDTLQVVLQSTPGPEMS